MVLSIPSFKYKLQKNIKILNIKVPSRYFNSRYYLLQIVDENAFDNLYIFYYRGICVYLRVWLSK